MYIKELVREEQREQQKISEEAELGKDVASLNRKKKIQAALQKEDVGKRKINSVKDDFDFIKHKHS